MTDRRVKTITLHAPGAETSDGQSTPFDAERFHEGLLFIEVTAAAGTNPTLDFDLESGPADDELGYVHTQSAQITGAGKVLVKLANIGPWLRLAWRIGGAAPSFTFAAKLALKN